MAPRLLRTGAAHPSEAMRSIQAPQVTRVNSPGARIAYRDART